MTGTSGLQFFWCLFLGLGMVLDLFSGNTARNLHVFGQITPLMVLQNIGVIVAVLVAAAAFYQVPALRFSWLHLFDSQPRNLNLDVVTVTAKIPVIGMALAAVAVVLFFLQLPGISIVEESMFRQGVYTWPAALGWSVFFGLVHCLVGVPLCAGLAISILGLWLHWQCFQGGVALSAVHHTAYNATLLAVIATVGTLVWLAQAPETGKG